MRLGKEQAVGYVEDTDYAEDTGAGALPAQELTVGQPGEAPLAPAPASPLTVS